MQQLVVTPQEEDQRLDSFLVKHFSRYSRVKLQRAIADQQVLVDDQPAKSSTRLKVGQRVLVRPIVSDSEAPIPEAIDLDVLYEDDHVVAINKPPAMVVHPAKGHWSGTLTAALAFHFEQLSSVGGPTRPGIVHRLDRDTSGVILVAKSDQAHLDLSNQFANRTVTKEYFAVVTPEPDRDRDLIDQPIGAHPYQREKKAVRHDHATSKPATTFYEVMDRIGGFAIVKALPKTGRTHQIRVHLASIGSPILCDALYSGRSRMLLKDLTRNPDDEATVLQRQALHARRIEFNHPVSGQRLKIEAPIASDLVEAINTIAQHRGDQSGSSSL